MNTKQDLIKTILRLDNSRSAQELEALAREELIILKVKIQSEYDAHHITLFQKGKTFSKKRKKLTREKGIKAGSLKSFRKV